MIFKIRSKKNSTTLCHLPVAGILPPIENPPGVKISGRGEFWIGIWEIIFRFGGEDYKLIVRETGEWRN